MNRRVPMWSVPMFFIVSAVSQYVAGTALAMTALVISADDSVAEDAGN